MSTRASWLVLAAATVAWLPGAALADIPPDPDSPDANCSKEKQCPTGEFCDYSFMPGQPESEWKHVGAECRTAAAAKGLQRRCRDGGNTPGWSCSARRARPAAGRHRARDGAARPSRASPRLRPRASRPAGPGVGERAAQAGHELVRGRQRERRRGLAGAGVRAAASAAAVRRASGAGCGERCGES